LLSTDKFAPDKHFFGKVIKVFAGSPSSHQLHPQGREFSLGYSYFLTSSNTLA
jgi:hypothetical protein